MLMREGTTSVMPEPTTINDSAKNCLRSEGADAEGEKAPDDGRSLCHRGGDNDSWTRRRIADGRTAGGPLGRCERTAGNELCSSDPVPLPDCRVFLALISLLVWLAKPSGGSEMPPS